MGELINGIIQSFVKLHIFNDFVGDYFFVLINCSPYDLHVTNYHFFLIQVLSFVESINL